jgi:hypothetical protein
MIPKTKIEYLPYGLSKGADFFTNDRGMFGDSEEFRQFDCELDSYVFCVNIDPS